VAIQDEKDLEDVDLENLEENLESDSDEEDPIDEVKIADNEAVERFQQRVEPPLKLLDKKNDVFGAYRIQLRNDYINKDFNIPVEVKMRGDDAIEEWFESNPLDKEAIEKKINDTLGERGVVVGDLPDEGLLSKYIGSSYVSAFSRVHPRFGTIPTYQAAAAEARKSQGKSLYNRAYSVLAEPIPQSLNIPVKDTAAMGITDEKGEIITEAQDKELFGVKVTNERLKGIAIASGVGGAAYGFTKGAIAGAPGGPILALGGGVAGALLGGISMTGVGGIGALGIGGLADVPGEYSKKDHLLDLAKRGWVNFGLGDDFADFYTILSDQARDAMVTNVVETADVLGVKDAVKLLDRHGIVDFEDLQRKTKESLEAHEEMLKTQSSEDIDFKPETFELPKIPGMVPKHPFATLNALFQKSPIQDQFLLDVLDIRAQVLNDPEYQEYRSRVRQDMMVQTKYDLDVKSRDLKPSPADDSLLVVYEAFKYGRITDEEKDERIQESFLQLSYNDLHPSLMKEQPDLNLFKQVAVLVAPDHPILQMDIDPVLVTAIQSVHQGVEDDKVQSLLNAIPFRTFATQYLFEEILESTIPSQKELDGWGLSLLKFQEEETGEIGARRTTRAAFDVMTDRVDDPKYGTFFKRSMIGEVLNWAGAVTTGAAEVEYSLTDNWITQLAGTDEILSSLLKNIGLPNGIYAPTPAGLDKMLRLGIRDPDDDFITRFDARMMSALGGFQVGGAEVATALGYRPDDIVYNVLQNLGIGLDSFLNLEKRLFKAGGMGFRTAANTPGAVTQILKGQGSPSIRYQLAKQKLFDGVVETKSSDSLVRINSLIQAGLRQRKNKGKILINDLTVAEREIVKRVLLLADRDPDKYIAADVLSSGDIQSIRKLSKEVINDLGVSEVRVFRSSPEYRKIQRQVQGLVNDKLIDVGDAQRFMTLIEFQAFKISDAVDTQFGSAVEVIRNLNVTRNRSAGPAARLIDDVPEGTTRTTDADGGRIVLTLEDTAADPDIRFARKKDIPLGYFEYDSNTRQSIINLFTRGDVDALWYENGHFMATLMGDNFNQKLFGLFDHTVNNQGKKRLTDVGHEQFAEAWRLYRRTKDAKNGFLRRMFDELYIGLHNFWSKLRNKPGLLPKPVRQYWDLEFGTLPSDRRNIDALTASVVRKRPYAIFVNADARRQVLDSKPAQFAREESAKQPSMNPEVIHQYLGDKFITRVDADVDPTTGQTVRSPRRVYADTTDDAIDVLIKTIAYIKTDRFRSTLKRAKTTTVGTGRYIVPVSRAVQILENVKKRLIESLGDFPDTKAKFLAQRGQDGNVDRSNLSPLVRPDDLAAFDERQRINSPGPKVLVDQKIRETEFFTLSDRQIAGMRTIIQEISQQPASDILPKGLLDPEANLRIMSVAEYDLVHKVMQDIEAGPLNRIRRGDVQPGFVRKLGILFESNELTKELGAEIKKLVDKFSRKELRFNRENANPDLVEVIEKHIRMTGKVDEDLVNAIESAKRNGAEYFIDFYQDQISLLVPLVPLTKVDKLFQIVDVFTKLRTGMDADALTKHKAAQQKTGVPARIIPDVITSKSGVLDIDYILNNLNDIQDILDGYHGMTRLERESLIALRTLKQKGVKSAGITDQQRLIAADAIQVLHNGLLEKYSFVFETAMDHFKIAMGVEGQKVTWNFNAEQILTIYKSYYQGDLIQMYQVGATKALVPLSPKAAKKLLGKTSKTDADTIALLTNVLVFGKISELRRGLAKELAEAGYNTNRRALFEQISKRADLGEVAGLDRQKYIERIAFYIDQELAFQDKVIIQRGTAGQKAGLLQAPEKAPEDLYGISEALPSQKNHPDSKVFGELEKAAKDEASRILDQMGIKRQLGTVSVLKLGDETFLLPESLIQGLEETMADIYKEPSFRLERNFGKNGTVEYALTGDQPKITVTIAKEMKDAARIYAQNFPALPKNFYKGLLISSGGVPMVPYFMGVYLGTVSQVQLGQGLAAAGSDLVSFPGVMTDAFGSYNNTKRINFVSGVLARTFGDGTHKPDTAPYIFKDGRVLTADGMANALIEEGVKGSFVSTLNNTNIHSRILNAFTQANPWVGGSTIGGAIGGMIGLLGGGPVGAVAGAASGAGLSAVTLSMILRPNGFFAKSSRFFGEVATAIDSYFRIRIMIREMENGADIKQAAKRTREIALDYSDLSDWEKNYISEVFAFYTYFKQATKLVAKSIVENPDRVLTQLKIARASQLKVTELEDPERVLSPWDRTRTFLPFKIGDHAIRLPYLITADAFALISDMIGSSSALPFTPNIVGEEQAQKSLLGLLSRANPYFLEFLYKPTTGLDPSRGFALERATNQVPSFIVQLDHDLLGGVLHDKFGIIHLPESQLKFVFNDKTGRKVNVRNIEMPGRGIYIATNPGLSNFVLEFMQTIGTGRMLDLIDAVDRSNIGLTEAMIKAADAYYQADKERPLLARVPGLVQLGVVKPTRKFTYEVSKKPGEPPQPVTMERPTDTFDATVAPGVKGYLDTATAHRAMREDFSYQGTDGTKYKLRYKDFYPLYLLKLIGLSPVHIDSEGEANTSFKIKQHLRELNLSKESKK